MSVDNPTDADADRNDEPPLYERDTAAVDRVADLVLLVLATTDTDRLPHDVLIPSVVTLVEDTDAFPAIRTESAGVDAFDALELFAVLDYIEDAPRDPDIETAALTDRGRQGARALIAGLTPEEQAALTDVTTGERTYHADRATDSHRPDDEHDRKPRLRDAPDRHDAVVRDHTHATEFEQE